MSKLNTIQKSRSFPFIVHVTVWVVLFCFPYFLTETQNVDRLIKHTWIPLCYFFVIFYLNFFWLIDNQLFEKKVVRYIILNIILIAAFTALNHYIKTHFFFGGDISSNVRTPRPSRKLFIYLDAISLLVPLVSSIALKISQRWVRTQAERKEIETAKLESELQSLRYQLQPHFFFNALNTIYSLVDISPDQAKETIHSLSKLMRYLLYETNAGKVSLKSEVDFVQRYIDLMRLRTSSKTTIIANFPAVSQHVQITPMLLITLVENAFKHGVSATLPTEIYMELQVEGNEIIFITRNQAINNVESDRSMSGIGLTNLKKRLDLIYPNAHFLEYGAKEGTFNVHLKLKYQ